MSCRIYQAERGHTDQAPQRNDADNARTDGRCDVIWNEHASMRDNYQKLGKSLAEKYADEMFRKDAETGGLVLATKSGDLIPISNSTDLLARIVDRLDVTTLCGDKSLGQIPAKHLSGMLKSEAFLSEFPVLDFVSSEPVHLADFRLATPGYNGGSVGERVLFSGSPRRHSKHLDFVSRFLAQMDFETNADRTNALAGALTVRLRNHWPGAKPILLYTATKSHSGKETCIDFCRNATKMVSISYQPTDWALERSFVGGITSNPNAGVISIDNARLGKGERVISSAFVERFVTDANPFLFASKTGAPRRVRNSFVVAISTNFGSVSEDILNRSLSVRLAPTGDLKNRKSTIDNPRYDYLPRYMAEIGDELRGMVERWKEEGMPLDVEAKHSFSGWAQVVGGILKCSGFDDFLGNQMSHVVKDPVRDALGHLGAIVADSWLTATMWVSIANKHGISSMLPLNGDRARELGVILSNHRDETFNVETDDHQLRLRLERKRARFEHGGEPSTRYRFATLDRTEIPVDGEFDAE
ncbi:MAG: hypothetical protein KDB23_02420 [Planctomycetales bacterium]|nr:hypothetical protein [Planctomycetales bacterium]